MTTIIVLIEFLILTNLQHDLASTKLVSLYLFIFFYKNNKSNQLFEYFKKQVGDKRCNSLIDLIFENLNALLWNNLALNLEKLFTYLILSFIQWRKITFHGHARLGTDVISIKKSFEQLFNISFFFFTKNCKINNVYNTTGFGNDTKKVRDYKLSCCI